MSILVLIVIFFLGVISGVLGLLIIQKTRIPNKNNRQINPPSRRPPPPPFTVFPKNRVDFGVMYKKYYDKPAYSTNLMDGDKECL